MIAKRAFLMGLALMLCAGFAAAQLTNKKREKPQDTSVRALTGVVRDAEENPVEGAVVKLKDMKTLQVRSFITPADGTYHFHGLSRTVDYEVKADSKGAATPTRTLSSFDDRLKAIINLKLEPKS
ncbi:MAG TPA: carboxypeptidase regulatory-like domain-containing protein [Solibacterales bacterium]|nr:carboxypeptidase regulatory-like domain-containing protein [Bryobacterales bacterium]